MHYLLVLIIAMCLRIVPLFEWMQFFNPDWVLLVLIYWSLAMPERFGVFNAWFTGLVTDVLTGRLLGQHALIYALVIFFCIKFHKRIRNYPLPQQSFVIFLCLLLAQSMVFWVESIKANTQLPLEYWMPVLTGTVVWPILSYLLTYLRSLSRTY